MTLQNDRTAAVQSATLTYDRTVDRAMVNRESVAEVFITDYQGVAEDSFVCGAQLPQYHGYFSDHLIQPESYDLLLLLECCRQAGTYSVYAHLGHAEGAVNLVDAFEVEITDTARLAVGHHPGELAMRFDVNTNGTKRQHTFRVEMLIDGAAVGWATLQARTAKASTFRALRRRHRRADPPSTRDLPAMPTGVPVSPRTVGRGSPLNVLLTDAYVESGSIASRLGLRPRNRSILDHEYDHYPAMALVEAERQAGLLALANLTGDPDAAQRMRAVSLSATFDRFAELDQAIVVRAVPLPEMHTPGAPIRLMTECEQNGQRIAAATIGYVPVNQ